MKGLTPMTRTSLAAISAAFALAAFPATACDLNIEGAAQTWRIAFDPFAQDLAFRQFDVALVNQGGAPCVGVFATRLEAETYGLAQAGRAERVAYALVDERTGVDITPRSGQSARQTGASSVALAPGERVLARFSATAAPTRLLSAGVYAQTLDLVVETEDGLPLAQRPVTLELDVASAAVMGLKGEVSRRTGAAVLDLGELTEGRRDMAASVYVLSTEGYSVSITSANQGRLRLGATEWFVPYGLALGDHVIDLAGGDRLEVVSREARSDDYPLTISVGAVAGKRAGSYSDVLTLTVAAL